MFKPSIVELCQRVSTLRAGVLVFTLGVILSCPCMAFAEAFCLDSTRSYSFAGFPGCVPSDVAPADFDADGDIDLAVVFVCGAERSSSFVVLMNIGCGNFADPVGYETGQYSRSIIAEDVDGNGFPDLITSSYWDNNVSVFLNHGDGTFADSANYPVGSFPQHMDMADLNGDIYPELVVANSSEGPGSVSVLINQGDGTFAPKDNYAVGSDPLTVVAADLNGDGCMDLATGNAWSKDASVLLNDKSGDLCNGVFDPAVPYAAGTFSGWINAGDLDTNGYPELLVANEIVAAGSLSVFRNNGDGTFAPMERYPAGENPHNVIVADFDKDGDVDVAVPGGYSDNVAVYENSTCDGTLDPPIYYSTGDAPISGKAADLDGDDDLDLITTNAYSHDLTLLFNCLISACACDYQSDFDEDLFLTALDLAVMIDILFAGAPDVQDPCCPVPRADFDCDGFSTALDLGGLIDHLFAGGDGPCDPCTP
jgi:hypothetical protein